MIDWDNLICDCERCKIRKEEMKDFEELNEMIYAIEFQLISIQCILDKIKEKLNG